MNTLKRPLVSRNSSTELTCAEVAPNMWMPIDGGETIYILTREGFVETAWRKTWESWVDGEVSRRVEELNERRV